MSRPTSARGAYEVTGRSGAVPPGSDHARAQTSTIVRRTLARNVAARACQELCVANGWQPEPADVGRLLFVRWLVENGGLSDGNDIRWRCGERHRQPAGRGTAASQPEIWPAAPAAVTTTRARAGEALASPATLDTPATPVAGASSASRAPEWERVALPGQTTAEAGASRASGAPETWASLAAATVPTAPSPLAIVVRQLLGIAGWAAIGLLLIWLLSAALLAYAAP